MFIFNSDKLWFCTDWSDTLQKKNQETITAFCLFSMSSDSSVIGHELNSHKLLPLLPALDYVTDTVAVLCTIFHFIPGSQELELLETVTY